MMKRQSTEWEKKFAKKFFDKGLISKVCKECKQLKHIYITQFKNGLKALVDISPVANCQQIYEEMFRITDHQGMKIEVTLRYSLILVRIFITN